ncbi:P-loop containing nucleoside triphosphate hydrolase protein [Fusarium flagelliforme]|uniref:P-loop containing nucleoside triphosphate hydrolase protein n=1 Tax=Fusarium flagelliforme TaxID=2675880 RepID=UPI001E8E66AF|nr:P-loop containing nucleoside triphosphate hydrolase protein [Fusarium flagelliforme]KAH7199130.1 P-loop containing nucleoside triphosphate hydrolase protein [Fusarium flagelliforme]
MSFQPQIAQLGKVLQDFGVPVICLTATLKPVQEMEFFQLMRFMPQRVIMFRELTTRKNIEYRVDGEEEGKEDHNIMKRVSQIVREWTAQHQEGKVIIYGRTIKRMQGIAKALAYPANREAKAQIVEKWISSRGGKSGWIAATNALGLGVNDLNVRLVVHGGMPRQLVNFVQESGRGGRNRQKSESVVVIRRS